MNLTVKEYQVMEVHEVEKQDVDNARLTVANQKGGKVSNNMSLRNLRLGLEMLSRYYIDQEVSHISCNEEELCAYATDKPMALEDVQKMIDLGWFQYRANKPPIGFCVEDYSPRGLWTAYV